MTHHREPSGGSERIWLEPKPLSGSLVLLEPLRSDHAAGLAEAAGDGDLWKLWYTTAPPPGLIPEEIAKRLSHQASGDWLPYAIMDQRSGRAIGMTGYLNIARKGPRLEIGGTWLAASTQRSGANVEAKFLLLAQAFEELGCIAVELRTNRFNLKSQRAIEALGARLDGVLRNHLNSMGQPRDTCVYSIIDSEWPQVRQHLTWRLSRF